MITSGSLNGRVLNIVIDFDMIVNTELGLIRFIREKFQDERAFKLDILNKSDREILSLLSSRNNWNPISVISTEENLSDIDDLYKSFFDHYKQEIISKSVTDKSIFDFVNILSSSSINYGINPVISVSDDIERKEISKHFNHIRTCMKNDYTSLLIKDAFYVKDYRFFTELKLENISKKKIYMLPKQYVFDWLDNNDDLALNNVITMFGRDIRNNSTEKGE